MNFALLEDIFFKKKYSYEKLLSQSISKYKNEKWGYGVMPPYSSEPYYVELFGHKPGKMLKKKSFPGKNKWRYLCNENNEFLCSTNFISQKDKEWLHRDEFYEYFDNYQITSIFSSVYGDRIDAPLNFIIYVEKKDNLIYKLSRFTNRSVTECYEVVYTYKNSEIINMKYIWPGYQNHERNYNIYKNNINLKITETIDDVEKIIYNN